MYVYVRKSVELTDCLAVQDTGGSFGILPGYPLFYHMTCLLLI